MNTFEMFEQWMGGRNEAFAPMFAFGKITADTVESVARRNYEVAGDYFDLGLSQLKVVSSGADVAQLSTKESLLANEFGSKVKAHAEGYMHIAAQAAEAYSAWTASFVEGAKHAVAPKGPAQKPSKKA